ncbi:DgyrCDS6488 [Dimorphilus gyrociliatus]|uniref:Protein THEM6 n=1 Tax=Dimorphilus gyrociliatus TaxID=2664684 RepID=A0A7I8VPS5_9ANNE|nr:DgyrCDS6488 [Dimorphilus gyrociliatus]
MSFKDSTVLKRRVGLRDLDIYLHMNNARYLWNLDFVRVFHVFEMGIYDLLKQKSIKPHFLLASSTIRYRRSLAFMEKYSIISNMKYFDDRNIYIQHNFVSDKDGFLSATAYAKIALPVLTPLEALKEITNLPEDQLKMECPEDLKDWIEYINKSSNMLKAAKTSN